MPDIKKEISTLMVGVRRKKRLPSSEVIVDETFKKLKLLPSLTPPKNVQSNFNQILKNVWLETLHVLEDYEERVYPSNIIDALMALKSDVIEKSKSISLSEGYQPAVKFLFVSLYPYFREIFLSISQGRMTRGGRDFELQFGKLLELMNVPYQKIKRA